MRSMLLALLVALNVSALAAELEANTQFDFLLGEHDVTLHAWTGDTWTPPRPVNATWNGWRGLGDAAIYDEWFDPQSGDGVNVRIFDETEAVWKMMWVGTANYQVQDLRAKFMNGVLTMWQVHPTREGWFAEFTVLSPCRWAREDFNRDQGGAAIPQFRLVATRRSCEES